MPENRPLAQNRAGFGRAAGDRVCYFRIRVYNSARREYGSFDSAGFPNPGIAAWDLTIN